MDTNVEAGLFEGEDPVSYWTDTVAINALGTTILSSPSADDCNYTSQTTHPLLLPCSIKAFTPFHIAFPQH